MSRDAAGSFSPASASASAVLRALIARGLKHVVVSPGSRSQALALEAAAAERRGDIQVHVRIDERTAGFTALGLALETGLPAAVICTSGTAVANLHPAVLEAHHSAVPLIVLSADRPPELRGIGANQTTTQPGMFGFAARWQADADVPVPASLGNAVSLAGVAFDQAAGTGARPGPVHLNLPYREPLSGAIDPGSDADVSADEPAFRTEPPASSSAAGHVMLDRAKRTVVIAGAGAGSDAEVLAHEAGLPLIAEIVSNARFGRMVVHDYRAALRSNELGSRIERAVVFGHPTLSREVTALLSADDVEITAVDGPGERVNLNGKTRAAASVAFESGDPDREWLAAWLQHSAAHRPDTDAPAPDLAGLHSTDPRARSAAARAELAAIRRPLDREQLVAAVWGATWPYDRLMFGSSMLVRTADAVLPGKKVPVFANRGLAGIDGTIATATGIALAIQAGVPVGLTRVVLGDLAFLHDAGSLLIPDAERVPRMQIIVGNDGGGTIFDTLEVRATAPATEYDRIMYTPQSVQFEHLARAYGWEYMRATTRSELDAALTAGGATPQVIEVPLTR